jgi:hypothetical protein
VDRDRIGQGGQDGEHHGDAGCHDDGGKDEGDEREAAHGAACVIVHRDSQVSANISSHN